MEISTIDAYALSSTIDPPQERPFHAGIRRLHKRDFVLVVVETPDGARGYAPGGASSSSMREFFEETSQDGFADVINGPVAEALEGERFDSVADATSAVDDLGLPELIESQTVATVDIALHDIRGKRQGAPIYDLLGEDEHASETLSLYASAGMYMDPEGYASQASTLADLGFAGYKYRPGIGPEADRQTVLAVREAAGPEMEIMVDAHTWWKLGDRTYTARERSAILEACEESGVFWLEEPVEPDDYDGYERLATEIDVSLAGGESETSPSGLRDLVDTGAVGFCQGDVRHHRGFTGCLDVAKYCAGSDVQFVPHQFGTHLGLVANAHLVAAAPEATLLEYPVFEGDPYLDADTDPGMYPYPLAFDILEDTLRIAGGELVVPDGPGLGVTVDMDVVEQYAFVEGPWSDFEYTSS